MPAFVVYDPYYDPVSAFATQEEADAACRPEGAHPGYHVLFTPDVEPASTAAMPYVPKPWEDD